MVPFLHRQSISVWDDSTATFEALEKEVLEEKEVRSVSNSGISLPPLDQLPLGKRKVARPELSFIIRCFSQSGGIPAAVGDVQVNTRNQR